MKNSVAKVLMSIMALVAVVFCVLYFVSNAQKNTEISTLKSTIASLDNDVTTLTTNVTNRDSQIESLTADIEDRDEQIKSLTADIADRDSQIESLSADISDRGSQIESLKADVEDRDEQIKSLTDNIAVRDEQIESLTADVADCNGQIEKLTNDVADKEKKIGDLSASLEELQKAVKTSSDIFDLASEQVVGIEIEYESSETNFIGLTSTCRVYGTGFIISQDGYIMTNCYGFEDAFDRNPNIEVRTSEGTKYIAAIVGVDSESDIAVLKIEADGFSAIQFGNSDTIHIGDEVYIIGSQQGESVFRMTEGYVCSKTKLIEIKEDTWINAFYINARINDGLSGSPIYTADGSVVGIVAAKYNDSVLEGIGLVIPINDAKEIADDLINSGYVTGRAYFGIIPDKRYNSMYSEYYGLPLGVYVADIVPESAAEKAGIQAGDIITGMGEYRIETFDDVQMALRTFSANESTEVTIFREGREQNLPVSFDEAIPDSYKQKISS